MPKRNIILISLDYPPERGGVARYLGNLVAHAEGRIRVIVEKGHDLSGPGDIEARELFRQAWPRWWPIVSVCLSFDRKTDILLVSHIFPVGTAAWISRMFGGPEYTLIVHGMDLRLAQSAWKRWLLKKICRNAKLVVTNSETTKQLALSLVPGLGMLVLTPGVEAHDVPTREEARHRLDLYPAQALVVSVGRLVSRKGIDVALRAMGRIQRKHDVMYIVIGDGQDAERLEQTVKESRTQVRWIHNADDAEKWDWLAAADVFLLPVRDEGDSVEGFGIVFLEAALAGIPSVAGKSGGVAEAVLHERTGLLVKPTSIDHVEDAVSRLLDNPELGKQLGATAKQRVLEEFRWEDRVAQLFQRLDS